MVIEGYIVLALSLSASGKVEKVEIENKHIYSSLSECAKKTMVFPADVYEDGSKTGVFKCAKISGKVVEFKIEEDKGE